MEEEDEEEEVLEVEEVDDVEVVEEELLVELVELVLVEDVEDGVGEALELVDATALELGEAELDDPPELLEPPAWKTTTLAVTPSGIVTTQKFPPPAPVADSSLVTSFTLLLAGSMLHGRPLQPSPSHSMLTPQDGSVLEKSLAR